MKQLNAEGFSRAREYTKSEARPLERALFEHYFESTPAAEAVEALTAFQNEDGGFGHGLEPDLQTTASSAYPTAIALRTLKDLKRDAEDPLVRRAARYLLDTFDGDKQVWRIISPEANEAPHAPWWHAEGNSLEEGFAGFRVNPRAEILGLLHHYSALVPRDWLEKVTEDTVSAIESGPGEWHDLLNAISLAETEALPEHYRERVIPHIRAAAGEQVKRDAEGWAAYGGQPLTVAPRPGSLLAGEFGEALERNLDYLIEQQSPEGTWGPNWSWGDFYPDAWEQARRDWTAILTLDALRTLRAYGRIEGLDPS